MITLITGKPQSGKSTLVEKLTQGKKTVWVPEFPRRKFPFVMVNSETEYIVLDEHKEQKHDKYSFDIFMEDVLRVDIPGRKPMYVEMPDIIIISRSLTKADIPLPNIKCIECINPIEGLFNEGDNISISILQRKLFNGYNTGYVMLETLKSNNVVADNGTYVYTYLGGSKYIES